MEHITLDRLRDKRQCLLLLLMAAPLLILQPALSQVVPSNRRTVWQGNVGVPGGIPSRTTVYTTIPAGASAATIQTAINNCPSNQVVQLAAGDYTISSTISLKSGVTLRGAGMTSTKLIRSGVSQVISVSRATAWDWDKPVPANHINWIANYAQGTTTLTLASTNLAGTAANVPIGRLIFIDQLNDTNTSGLGTYDSVVSGGYTSIASPNYGSDRYQNQMSRVVSKSGNDITIFPPIYMPNYRAGLIPQIWWESANPIEFAGVEDLWVAVTDVDAYAIYFNNAYACWSKNVKTTQARRHHAFWQTVNCEVRSCRMETLSGSTDDYTLSVFNSSAGLYEDNIFNNLDNAMVYCAMSGSVFAYNYVTNLNSPAFMRMGIYSHGGHPSMNLFEGNVGVGLAIDNGWGSSIYQTALRNRFTGTDESNPSASNFVQPITVGATNRFMNIVGNVLGTTGKNTAYQSYAQTSGCNEGGRVYYIGYKQVYCDATYDPTTYNTLLRAMNWTSATATNGGVVPGGYASSDIPNSYYLSAKPSYFGTLTWPPIDPTNAVYSSSRTNIPAGYRFIYGRNPSPGIAPPGEILAYYPNSGKAPLDVKFSSNGPNVVDFGDGTMMTNALSVIHTYANAGTYVGSFMFPGKSALGFSIVVTNATP